jgi:hypothetical protein
MGSEPKRMRWMLTWANAPIIGALAIAIGYTVGKMPC